MLPRKAFPIMVTNDMPIRFAISGLGVIMPLLLHVLGALEDVIKHEQCGSTKTTLGLYSICKYFSLTDMSRTSVPAGSIELFILAICDKTILAPFTSLIPQRNRGLSGINCG